MYGSPAGSPAIADDRIASDTHQRHLHHYRSFSPLQNSSSSFTEGNFTRLESPPDTRRLSIPPHRPPRAPKTKSVDQFLPDEHSCPSSGNLCKTASNHRCNDSSPDTMKCDTFSKRDSSVERCGCCVHRYSASINCDQGEPLDSVNQSQNEFTKHRHSYHEGITTARGRQQVKSSSSRDSRRIPPLSNKSTNQQRYSCPCHNGVRCGMIAAGEFELEQMSNTCRGGRGDPDGRRCDHDSTSKNIWPCESNKLCDVTDDMGLQCNSNNNASFGKQHRDDVSSRCEMKEAGVVQCREVGGGQVGYGDDEDDLPDYIPLWNCHSVLVSATSSNYCFYTSSTPPHAFPHPLANE